ncbi:Lrp/AsnC family transcriptional regulator [uncultured Litoreibacter sp.]|uniref:Lrp/AsnC family transcriptional regulator n=1 Tax=uncultured Litoreibacter sp. TaxID=1392394 RepID=UPI0026348F35|nr:Lrp/AsnC family transcriptional regulator [uncultured Litoreibacter sp.]
MDEIDQRLVALLKNDGRATVTTLAGELKMSRVTVQSRVERMKRDGTIRRFTVELGRVGLDELIHAIMMIEVKGAQTASVIKQLRRMPEIVDLHTTNGVWDLVARIETISLPDFDRILRQVREVQGVTGSETSLLLDRARG